MEPGGSEGRLGEPGSACRLHHPQGLNCPGLGELSLQQWSHERVWSEFGPGRGPGLRTCISATPQGFSCAFPGGQKTSTTPAPPHLRAGSPQRPPSGQQAPPGGLGSAAEPAARPPRSTSQERGRPPPPDVPASGEGVSQITKTEVSQRGPAPLLAPLSQLDSPPRWVSEHLHQMRELRAARTGDHRT